MSEFILVALAIFVIYRIAMQNRATKESTVPRQRPDTRYGTKVSETTPFIRTRATGDIIMDERNKLFKIKGVNFKVFNYEDLIKYEMNEDGRSITSGGLSIGMAVVGSVFGPLGTFMGGVTGSKKSKDIVTDMHIALTIRGENKGYYKISFINKKTKRNSKEYKKQLELARETLGMLDIMTDEVK